ncbi:MAG: aldo/keto reductase [Armatimonadota bacterium]
MEYRTLGRTGLSVSAIGLGTEYLLDVPPQQAIGVVRRAVEAGVNYFDLFYAQPAFRDTMGEAFAGLRDRVLLTAHLGAGETGGQYERIRDPQRCADYIEDNLERYRTDHVEVLFLHNCDEASDFDAIFAPGGLADAAERFRRQGKARFIGFSTHRIDTARRAIETGRLDVLMFPINLPGHATPGRRELFQTCLDRGIGLVAMKPYGGGKLLTARPASADDRRNTSGRAQEAQGQAATPVQCLAYALSQPGVATVVPGCSNLSQLEDALAWADASDAERDFAPVLAGLGQSRVGECVYCNHCLPCPAGIDIGAVMRLLDRARVQVTAALRAEHASLAVNADDCRQCGACTPRCPFGVDPAKSMEEAQRLLA